MKGWWNLLCITGPPKRPPPLFATPFPNPTVRAQLFLFILWFFLPPVTVWSPSFRGCYLNH